MPDDLYEHCGICGNGSSYDEESLKASTYEINGVELVLCCPCEDALLLALCKGRGLKVHLSDDNDLIFDEAPKLNQS